MSDTNPENLNVKNSKKKTHPYLGLKIFLTTFVLAGVGLSGYFIGKATALNPEEKKLVEEYNYLKNEWLFGDDDLAAEAAMGIAYYPAAVKGDAFTFYTSTTEGQGLATDGNGFGFATHAYDGGLYITDVYEGNALGRLHVGDVLLGVKRGQEAYYEFASHSNAENNAYLSQIQDTTTSYIFTLKRDGVEMQSEVIHRGPYSQMLATKIAAPKGESELPKGSAAIEVSSFLGNAAFQFETQVKKQLDENGGKLNHLIIDLRGNGGGDVAQAELMADMFVKKGTIIYQMRDKNNRAFQTVKQRKDPEFNGLIDKFTILLDGRSASASEIFTLAMRAGANTKVYGLNSYGKGIAQKLVTFKDGSVIRYTYAKVFGPKRQNETMVIEDKSNDDKDVMCIHHQGIAPDEFYPTNYVVYDNAIDFTSSLGVSESYQNYFLSMMNVLDDASYPDAYSATYHFDDAISQFAAAESISVAFDDQGRVSKAVSDRFSKVTYDLYLEHQEKLLKNIWEAL